MFFFPPYVFAFSRDFVLCRPILLLVFFFFGSARFQFLRFACFRRFDFLSLAPQIIGVLSSKEGTLICEMDGWMLGGVHFGVLVQVLFGVLFEVLVMARGHSCDHAAWAGVLAQAWWRQGRILSEF